MPGRSFRGAFPLPGEPRGALDQILEKHVRQLAETIGPRHAGNRVAQLTEAAEYIERSFTVAGYAVRRQEVPLPGDEPPVYNIEAERKGVTTPENILIIGAHYDSVAPDCPGANDNASGVAAVLALAERLSQFAPGITIRFVAFANEEPPYFLTPFMGSLVYATEASERGENIVGMFSLETIGYYSQEPKSQRYPFSPLGWLYPTTGNYVAMISNLSSGMFLRRSLSLFRREAEIPSEGIAAPEIIPGVSWSDHWSFAAKGYSAIMVTDTAPFRYPDYHQPTDTWDKLNYAAIAKVVEGMEGVIRGLSS